MSKADLHIKIRVDGKDAQRKVAQTEQSLDRLGLAIKRVGHYGSLAFAGWGIGQVAGGLAGITDEFKNLNARIKVVSDSNDDAVRSFSDLLAISQRFGVVLSETAQLYQGIGRSKDALGATREDIVAITEAVQAAGALSGSGQAAFSGAVLQLSQMFAGTKVQAQELNSLIDGMPVLVNEIAKGMGLTTAEFIRAGKSGKLLVKDVYDAILKRAPEITRQAQQLPNTIERATNRLSNAMLVWLGQADDAAGVGGAVADSINSIAENFDTLANVAGAAAVVLVSVFTGRALAGIVSFTVAQGQAVAAQLRARDAAQAQAAAQAQVAKQALAAAQAQRSQAQASLAMARAHVANISLNERSGAVREAAAARVAAARNQLRIATQAASAAEIQHAAAIKASAAAGSRTTAVMRGLSGTIGLLGGPIGLITTALTLGASAWAIWGNSAESAAAKAERARQSLKEQVEGIQQRLSDEGNFGAGEIGAVRKYIDDLERRIDVIAQSRSPAARERLRQMREELEKLYDTEAQLAARARQQREQSLLPKPPKQAAIDAWKRYVQQFASNREKLEIEMKRLRKLAADAGVSETSDAFRKAAAALREKILGNEGGDLSEIQKARLEAETEVRRIALERQEADLKRSLQSRLVSLAEYFSEKTRIEQAQIDTEITEVRQQITVARNTGDQAEAIRLETELKRLNEDRSRVAIRNAAEQAAAERELTASLRRVRDELARLTGEDTGDAKAAVAARYKDLRAQLEAEGNTEGVGLVDRLIDASAATENMARIEAQWRQTLERMRQAQEAVQIQQQAGLISEYDARQQIIALQHQSAAELQAMLPLLEQNANAIGPDAVLRVQSLSLELERMKLVADEMGPLWNDIGAAFGQGLEGMILKATSWRQAMMSIYQSVAQAFVRRLVTEPFQKWITSQIRMSTVKKGLLQQEVAQEQAAAAQKTGIKASETAATVSMEAAKAGAGAAASQASIPIVGPVLAIAKMALITAAVMALLNKVQKFASGGYVTGPGTSTSDSIPARLSAGEYVIRAAAVRRVGVQMLDAINGGAFEPVTKRGALAFAQGGLVPDPAPAAQGGESATQGGGQPVRIVNVIDPSMAADYLNSSNGEKTILNVLRRNAGAVQQIIG